MISNAVFIFCLQFQSVEKLFEIYGGNIKTVTKNEELFELSLDHEFRITSSKIYYQTNNEWHGNKIFSNEQIPAEGMISSVKLDENWRQCSECSEAWECDSKIKLARCPKCNTLTELESK